MVNTKLIVPSLAETDAQELQELSARTAPERAWYAGCPVFETNQDILAAAQRGELVAVMPDENIAPISRLRNPELFRTFTPYLLPDSQLALAAVGNLWREQLQAEGLDVATLVLAATSFARSNESQQDLVQSGKLAHPESTHRMGAAFDIDASGYYEHDPEQGYVPIVDPRRSRRGMQQAARVLKAAVYQGYDMPAATRVYDPRIPEALITVAQVMHDQGLINLIVEFADQPNQCVHIAPNPEVDWLAAA